MCQIGAAVLQRRYEVLEELMGHVGQHELMQSAHPVLIGYLEVLDGLAQVTPVGSGRLECRPHTWASSAVHGAASLAAQASCWQQAESLPAAQTHPSGAVHACLLPCLPPCQRWDLEAA